MSDNKETLGQDQLRKLLESQGTEMDPSIRTGVGDPTSRYYGELLSEEEEKRIDADDRVIVDKNLWSEGRTDVWLSIYGTRTEREVGCDRPYSGQSLWLGNTMLTVAVTDGKPRWNQEGFGLALELPADLGSDDSKRDYLTQWVVETTKEVFIGCETVLPAGTEDNLAVWLVTTVDKHIRMSRL
jgi:hypothetical protein